jgi:2-keto-4-pentenoate hydratase
VSARATAQVRSALPPADLRAAADALHSAEVHRRPIAPLTQRFPEMSVVDAYRIQLINVADRVDNGAVVRGHKVGLSSRAMQQMMAVDEPDYGHLLSDMFVAENTPIDITTLCNPRVEVEVAFVLGEALPVPGCTVADALRCTAFVLPALEIIDSRIQDWNVDLRDTVADNASSGLVVLGGQRTTLDGLDLHTVGAVLRRNSCVVATGASGAVLGNPVTALAWLANTVHRFGVILEAGHVILPGSFTRAYDVSAGQTVTAEFDRIGSVTTRFDAARTR